MGVSYSNVESDERSPIKVNSPEDVLNYLLNTNTFGRKYQLNEMKAFSSSILVKKYKKDDILFEIGEDSSSFLFLALGKVSLLLEDNKPLKHLAEGDVVGGYDFVKDDKRRVSAICRSSCILFEISRENLKTISNLEAAEPILTYLKGIEMIPNIDEFKDMILLSNLEPSNNELVAQLLTGHTYPKGTTLLQEQQLSDKCYFIMKGEVVATLNDSNGFLRELSTVSIGGCIGERSLMADKEPASCTITSLTEVEVLTLKKIDFRKLLEISPKMLSVLKRRKTHFTTIQTLLDEMPVFKDLVQRKKLKLGYCVKKQIYKNEEIVLEQNQLRQTKERYLYIVIDGTAEIIRNGEKIGEVSRGKFFGEISLLNPETMNQATIKAKEGLQCYLLSKSAFTNIFANERVLLAEIIIKILAKKSPLSVLLKHPITRKSLEEHCKQEFSAENVEFWTEVDELESIGRITLSDRAMDALAIDGSIMKNKKKKILKEKATYLIENFIMEESTNEVNIHGDTRTELTDKFNKQEFSFDMFAEAKETVFLLLNNDTFARFKRSLKFTGALRKIHSYNTDTKEFTGKVDPQLFFELLKTDSGVFGEEVTKKVF